MFLFLIEEKIVRHISANGITVGQPKVFIRVRHWLEIVFLFFNCIGTKQISATFYHFYTYVFFIFYTKYKLVL